MRHRVYVRSGAFIWWLFLPLCGPHCYHRKRQGLQLHGRRIASSALRGYLAGKDGLATGLEQSRRVSSAMHGGVACSAKGNEVLARIVAGSTAKPFVVNLKIGHRTARLAFPAVAAEHFIAKLVVQFGVQTDRCALWSEPVQETFPIARSRKAFLSSSGRNLNKHKIEHKSTFELPASRLAPARKSAQIISRQYPLDLSVPSIRAAVSIAWSTTGIWLLYSLKYDRQHRGR